MFGSEGVPQGIGIVGNSFMHFPVERAIVSAIFRELTGILKRMEESSIENNAVVFRTAFQLNLGKGAIPSCTDFLYCLPERGCFLNLFGKIFSGLFKTDERAANPQLHHFRTDRKCHISACRGSCFLSFPCGHKRVLPNAIVGKISRKLQYIVPS